MVYVLQKRVQSETVQDYFTVNEKRYCKHFAMKETELADETLVISLSVQTENVHCPFLFKYNLFTRNFPKLYEPGIISIHHGY